MNYLSLLDLTPGDVQEIFAIADRLVAAQNSSPAQESSNNAGCAVLFFPESSIRTRLSFERGFARSGYQSVLFPPETLDKREALEDVAGYIANWADVIVARHPSIDRLKELAASSPVPVINAMTSWNHPCEILGDVYALCRGKSAGTAGSARASIQSFEGMQFTFVGAAGNIARSWMHAAQLLNFFLVHVADEEQRLASESEHYHLSANLDAELAKTAVLLTDPLPSSCRNPEYYRSFQITPERLDILPRGAMINPCPPFYRGEEIAKEVVADSRFVGYGFKRSLLEVQMAVVQWCLNKY